MKTIVPVGRQHSRKSRVLWAGLGLTKSTHGKFSEMKGPVGLHRNDPEREAASGGGGLFSQLLLVLRTVRILDSSLSTFSKKL